MSVRKSLWQHPYYVVKMLCQQRVNDFGPWIVDNARDVPGLHQPIIKLLGAILGKIHLIPSSLCPKKQRTQSVQHFRPRLLDNQWAMWILWFIIKLLAGFLGKNCCHKIKIRFQDECQWSVHDVWSSIYDNLMALELRSQIMIWSAAFITKNASDHIASCSYHSVPTRHSQFLWALRIPHSNKLYCAVLKLCDVVSLWNLSWYTTSQLCMHCITDRIFLRAVVQSIIKNTHTGLLYRYLR